ALPAARGFRSPPHRVNVLAIFDCCNSTHPRSAYNRPSMSKIQMFCGLSILGILFVLPSLLMSTADGQDKSPPRAKSKINADRLRAAIEARLKQHGRNVAGSVWLGDADGPWFT